MAICSRIPLSQPTREIQFRVVYWYQWVAHKNRLPHPLFLSSCFAEEITHRQPFASLYVCVRMWTFAKWTASVCPISLCVCQVTHHILSPRWLTLAFSGPGFWGTSISTFIHASKPDNLQLLCSNTHQSCLLTLWDTKLGMLNDLMGAELDRGPGTCSRL